MGTLQEYAESAFYEQKEDRQGDDFVLGKETETWIQALMYNTPFPFTYPMTVMEDVAIDDEIIMLKTDRNVTLYRGDYLKFDTDTMVIIAQDTLIGTESTSVKILPALSNIDKDSHACTYAMIPIISMTEGSLPDSSGSDTESMNKTQGLFSAKRTVKRDGSVTIAGKMLKNDPSLPLLQRIGLGSRNIFFQSRYSPFVNFEGYPEGGGPGAFEMIATLTNNSYPTPNGEFVEVNYTITFGNSPKPFSYQFFDQCFTMFYCRRSLPDYSIDYDIIPEEDTSNYCELTIAGFYDFDTAP